MIPQTTTGTPNNAGTPWPSYLTVNIRLSIDKDFLFLTTHSNLHVESKKITILIWL